MSGGISERLRQDGATRALTVAQWLEVLLELDLGTDAERSAVEDLLEVVGVPLDELPAMQEAAVGLAGMRDSWSPAAITALEDEGELAVLALALALRAAQQLESFADHLDNVRLGEARPQARALRNTRSQAVALLKQLRAVEPGLLGDQAKAHALWTIERLARWLPASSARSRSPSSGALDSVCFQGEADESAGVEVSVPTEPTTPVVPSVPREPSSTSPPVEPIDWSRPVGVDMPFDNQGPPLREKNDTLDEIEVVGLDEGPRPGSSSLPRSERPLSRGRSRSSKVGPATAPDPGSARRTLLLLGLLLAAMGLAVQFLFLSPPSLPQLSEHQFIMSAVDSQRWSGSTVIFTVDPAWKNQPLASRNYQVHKILRWVDGEEYKRAEFHSLGIRLLVIDENGAFHWSVVEQSAMEPTPEVDPPTNNSEQALSGH